MNEVIEAQPRDAAVVGLAANSPMGMMLAAVQQGATRERTGSHRNKALRSNQ